MWCGWYRTAYAVYVQQILSKIALHWHGGDGLLNKVVIFIFFAYKNHSCRFIAYRLNHWWQKDYSDDVFHTFLGLELLTAGTQMALVTGDMTPSRFIVTRSVPLTVSMKSNIGKQRINQGFHYVHSLYCGPARRSLNMHWEKRFWPSPKTYS